MLIEEEALKYWMDNFYGYGSWHARFWFVGYEESGGDVPEEVAEKLNYFLTLPTAKGPRFATSVNSTVMSHFGWMDQEP